MPEENASPKGFKDSDLKGKVISIIVLTIFLMTVWFMLEMVLLTFIVTFIFYHCMRLVRRLTSKTFIAKIPDGIILALVFIIGIAFLVLCSVAFVPILIDQGQDIARAFIAFDLNSLKDSLDPRLTDIVWGLNIETYIDRAGIMMLNTLMDLGAFSLNLLIAIALSFIMLLEKSKIKAFGELVGRSRLSFIYNYFMFFGGNFCITFAKVMKVQVTIAFLNAVISIILLALLGFKSIIWGLGVMIFVLGLIPVAGVIISLVPLSIIAFNIGGLIKVIQVLVMVAVIHAIEAYILNPKLMSNRTELPVSFVFIILLVAEQYLHVWGLLIGVPLFIFILTIFGVKYEDLAEVNEQVKEKKKEKRLAKLNETKRKTRNQ